MVYFWSWEDLTVNVTGSAGGASEGEEGRSEVSLDDIVGVFGCIFRESFVGFGGARGVLLLCSCKMNISLSLSTVPRPLSLSH